ncbi:hypothetical protein KSS87_017616, partial [Heliosperma pusillum]
KRILLSPLKQLYGNKGFALLQFSAKKSFIRKQIMDDFGLNEMEMNMSFTDLLNRPQMNNIFEEDIGLNVADETIVLHE